MSIRAVQQRLLDAMADAIVIIDPAGIVEQLNTRAGQLFGYPADEFVGHPIARLVSPRDQLALDDARAAVFGQPEGQHSHELRLDGCRRDGSEFPIELTLARLATDDGDRALATVRDMTEQRRAERALRGSSRLLEACFKHMLTQIAILDPEFNFVRVNESYAKATDYDVEYFPGKNHFELFPSDAKAIFERVIATGEPFQTFARPFVHPNHPEWGVTYWDWTLVPVFDEDGAVELLVFALEHVTERVRTAEELRAKDVQLVEARQFEAVGQLAAGIAHDFNNVLTSVLFTFDLLKPRVGEDVMLTTIVDEALDVVSRAKTLTSQLLSFGRKQLLLPELVELNDAVRRRSTSVRQLLPPRTELRIVTGESGTCYVKVDPGQLDRILLNLTSNAADAMPDGGRLTIMTTHVDLDSASATEHPGLTPGAYVMVVVQDSGIGMDEATRARVFEPFFTTKSGRRGTGLGLSSVHGIVKQSGGEIFVHSELGQGTTFKIYFPRVSAPEPTRRPSAQPSPQPPTPSVRAASKILVVEDEAIIRKLIVEGLRRFGYLAEDVRSGDAALEYLDAHADEVAVVLTDIVMTNLDGVALANRIVQAHPQLRVVLMSGYADRQASELARPFPMILKPFAPKELALLIERVLARPPDASLD